MNAIWETAEQILLEEVFSQEEKDKFFNQIYKRYFKDEDYRNSIMNKYVLFVNNNFYGLIDKPEDSYDVTNQTDRRHIFPVTYNEIDNSFFKVRSDILITELNNGETLSEHCYKLDCRISAFPDDLEDTLGFSNQYLFDTGASNTTFCGVNNWDYLRSCFYSSENDPRIEELNSRIGYVMNRKFQTSSGIIYGKLIFLRIPMYIKIEDLDYYPLYSFVPPHVSLKDAYLSKGKLDKDDFLFLLGMDNIKNLSILSVQEEHPYMSIYQKRQDKINIETVTLEKGLALYDKYLEDLTKYQNNPLLREMSNIGSLKNIYFRALNDVSFSKISLPEEYLFTLKKNITLVSMRDNIQNKDRIMEYVEEHDQYDGLLYKDEFKRDVIYLKDSRSCLRLKTNKDKINSIKSTVCGFGVVMI